MLAENIIQAYLGTAEQWLSKWVGPYCLHFTLDSKFARVKFLIHTLGVIALQFMVINPAMLSPLRVYTKLIEMIIETSIYCRLFAAWVSKNESASDIHLDRPLCQIW